MHVRTQIRQAFATALTGLATTGSHVFVSAVYALADADLPALRIFNGGETVNASTIHGPPVIERTLQVRVEAVVKEVDDYDLTLDQIALEVEQAIANAFVENDITVNLASISEPNLSGSAEKPVGQLTMTFDATYFTAADAPDVAL